MAINVTWSNIIKFWLVVATVAALGGAGFALTLWYIDKKPAMMTR